MRSPARRPAPPAAPPVRSQVAGDAALSWSVHDLDGRRPIAAGDGHAIRFAGTAGVRYMIEVRKRQ